MEKPSIRELAGHHPVPFRNAIEALTTRWSQVAEVDVELLAPPGFLRASSAEVREALRRRFRARQGKDLEI